MQGRQNKVSGQAGLDRDFGGFEVADLANLSNDINLAARNALAAMIDHIVATYGYDRLDAYVIASIAVDLRIGQLVDTPNVGVTAILPLDIFENP